MPARLLHRATHLGLAVAALSLCIPAVAPADTVVPNNQIVQGHQCLGLTCADGESMFGGILLYEKASDTPGIRLVQTGDGGFTPQTWDIGGNEANFYVRDVTGGSRLPFRIRPGAPTSSLDIAANGDVSSAGVVQQSVAGLVPAAPLNGDATLAALRGLAISRYTVAGAEHAMPAGDAFRSAFALGAADTTLAPQDVAAVALAAVKALDARVSTLARTPGPKGDTGSSGAPGTAGAPGAPGAAAPAADLASANARIAALERSNARMAKTLTTLAARVGKLTKSKKRRASKKRSARAAAVGR